MSTASNPEASLEASERIYRQRANGAGKKAPDIGGTPGFDCPWPCQVFGRPCIAQVQKLGFHNCAAEPYGMRAWWAEREAAAVPTRSRENWHRNRNVKKRGH